MSRKRKVQILCIVLALIAAVAAGLTVRRQRDGSAAQKMLLSWDFSQGLGQFRQNAYSNTGTSFSLEANGGLEDSACIRIESTQSNDARYVVTVNTQPGAYYRISAWVRTEGIPSGEDRIGANISALNTFYRSESLYGDQDWTYVELYGRAGERQESLSICMRLGFYNGDNTGTAWFDDVEIEQLSALPAGVVAVPLQNTMYTSTEVYYDDAMKVGALVLLTVFLIFAVLYRYARLRDFEGLCADRAWKPGRIPLSVCVGLLVFAGLLIRMVLAVTAPQCNIDVGLFQYWGQRCLQDGIPHLYQNAEKYNLDYPPLYIYFLWFNTLLARMLGIVGTAGYTLLIKMPSMLADCAIAFLLYWICRKQVERTWILFIVAIWLFNPMVLLDSAAWGQVDSLLALPLCLMVYFITEDKLVPASAALAFAVILKPQGIFLAPILGYAWLRRFFREKEISKTKQIGSLFGCIGAFAGVILAVALPFGILQKPNFFTWLFNLYVGTANGYKGATVNSYNFFYVLGENWTNDSLPWLGGWSFLIWGILFIVLSCLVTGVLYLYGPKRKELPFLLSAMLVYAVTMFGPRMHERYFFPCIALLLFAAVYANNKVMLGFYAGISAVNFLSVLSVMMGLEVGGLLSKAGASTEIYGWYYWAGKAVHRQGIAVVNLMLCLGLILYTAGYIVRHKETDPEHYRLWSPEEVTYEEVHF